jgi:hypothetical protein
MNDRAKFAIARVSLSVLIVALTVVVPSRLVAGKSGDRLTADRVASFSRGEVLAMRKEMVTERDDVVTGLLRILGNSNKPDELRLAAVAVLGATATREALNYCIDHIDLKIVTESDEDDPDQDYPCVRALISAGWQGVPLLLERGQRVGVSETHLRFCAHTLRRLCGISTARALLRDSQAHARDSAKSTFAVMLKALE